MTHPKATCKILQENLCNLLSQMQHDTHASQCS